MCVVGMMIKARFWGGVLLGCLPHHSLWIVVAIMVAIPAVVVFAAVVFAPVAVISAVVVVAVAAVVVIIADAFYAGVA